MDKKCIKCNNELQQEDLFCTECGLQYNETEKKRLSSVVKTCNKCSAEIAKDEEFCTECGSKQPKDITVMPTSYEIKCCKCNLLISYDNIFCPECGSEQPEVTKLKDNVIEKRCHKCRTLMSDDDIFCTVCGSKYISKEKEQDTYSEMKSIGINEKIDKEYLISQNFDTEIQKQDCAQQSSIQEVTRQKEINDEIILKQKESNKTNSIEDDRKKNEKVKTNSSDNSLVEKYICSKCGYKINIEDNMCPYCLTETLVVSNTNANEQEDKTISFTESKMAIGGIKNSKELKNEMVEKGNDNLAIKNKCSMCGCELENSGYKCPQCNSEFDKLNEFQNDLSKKNESAYKQDKTKIPYLKYAIIISSILIITLISILILPRILDVSQVGETKSNNQLSDNNEAERKNLKDNKNVKPNKKLNNIIDEENAAENKVLNTDKDSYITPENNNRPLKTIEEDMIMITGGWFYMGSNEGGIDEKPVHKVWVDNYEIKTTEVTVEEYREFCSETAYKLPEEPVWGWHDSHPIVNVNWYDAVAFCKWKSKKEGKTYRLPTEAEWEYAAKGGNIGAKFKYAGSDKLDQVGWYFNISEKKTHPVKSKQANGLGIYDMSGNVSEWCQDWYDEGFYRNKIENNPEGPNKGILKVLRGGSWNNYESFCSVTFRITSYPGIQENYFGFRYVRAY